MFFKWVLIYSDLINNQLGRRVKRRGFVYIYGNCVSLRVGRQYGVWVCQWEHCRGLWEGCSTYWSVALGEILSSSYSAPAGVCHPGSKAHLTRAAQREASDTRSSFHAAPTLPGPAHPDMRSHRQAITSISISFYHAYSLSLSLGFSAFCLPPSLCSPALLSPSLPLPYLTHRLFFPFWFDRHPSDPKTVSCDGCEGRAW